jgi:hypothetical protein
MATNDLVRSSSPATTLSPCQSVCPHAHRCLQLSEEMKRQGISKARLAKLMNTSRPQVDRILKARGNVAIETPQRVAALVGRQLRLELVLSVNVVGALAMRLPAHLVHAS